MKPPEQWVSEHGMVRFLTVSLAREIQQDAIASVQSQPTIQDLIEDVNNAADKVLSAAIESGFDLVLTKIPNRQLLANFLVLYYRERNKKG